MYSSAKPALWTAFSCLVVLSLSSCGGGGNDGGSSIPVAAANQTIVTGTVQAPGGQIAFFKKPGFGDWFESEAYAALTGLSNVDNGTIVQLARLNPTASGFAVLATTTVSGGRYSFNLTSLGLQPSNDLIVRVEGSGGKVMRAFVTGTLINLDPISEASFQAVSAKLTNGALLSQFTVQELRDIRNALSLIVGLNPLSSGGTIQDTVDIITARIDPKYTAIDRQRLASRTNILCSGGHRQLISFYAG